MARAANANFLEQVKDANPEDVSWSTLSGGPGFTYNRPSGKGLVTPNFLLYFRALNPQYITRFASTIVKLHREHIFAENEDGYSKARDIAKTVELGQIEVEAYESFMTSIEAARQSGVEEKETAPGGGAGGSVDTSPDTTRL